MKSIPGFFLGLLLISSCHKVSKNIIEPGFTDSLILNYHRPVSMQTADSNLAFWERRMQALPDHFVNGPKYAAALSASFRLYGDIQFLRKADSLLMQSHQANQEKDPDILRSLASFALLQHQFPRADSLLKKALLIDGQSIPNSYLEFDVAFETGQFAKARNLLTALHKDHSYGYLFRRSKYEHYAGSLDSAVNYMMQAAEKAGNNKYLQQAALSNAADLYVHKGDLKTAYDLYVQSIRLDAADLHSIAGLGWIALIHDKNDSLAEKIFKLVQRYTRSPDMLLKLAQAGEARGDTFMIKKYATAFADQAGNAIYGKMYSKYLVDLYTGILENPARAVQLAEQETYNRPAPQVYAWYAWSLFCNNEKVKAYQVFKGYVSKKPLEALELFYMGKMMQGLDKNYNAQQFFKAAWKNRYDLSPAKLTYLEENME